MENNFENSLNIGQSLVLEEDPYVEQDPNDEGDDELSNDEVSEDPEDADDLPTVEFGVSREGDFLGVAKNTAPQEAPSTKITPDDKRLRDALGMIESSGNPNAVGPMTKYGTAKGKHQFIDSTWEQYGAGGNVFNPEDSDKASQKYLNFLYKHYDEDINLTLAAYHSGEGNVDDAIKSADSKAWFDVAPHLGPNGRNYPGKVLGEYSKTSPELVSKVAAAKNPSSPLVTPDKAFADKLDPILNSPDFQALSATNQISTINAVYQNNIPTDKIKKTLKKFSDNIWSSASPEELDQLNAEFGRPDKAGVIESGKNVGSYVSDWHDGKLAEIEKMGIAPELLSKPFEDHYNEIKADENQAYQIRSKSKFRRMIDFLGDNERTIAKGAIDSPFWVASALTNQLGAHAESTTIAKLPDTLFGEERRDAMYETQDGYVLTNEDGTPRTRWQTDAYRGVANAFSFFGAAKGLQLLGAGTSAIGLTLGGSNALIIGNQSFQKVLDETGDKTKAYNALLLSLPAAATDTLVQMSFLSRFASPALKVLSPLNQMRVVAATVAKAAEGGLIGGTTLGLQDAIQQLAETSQTGQELDPKRTKSAAILGAAGGAVAAPVIGGLHGKQKLPPNLTPEGKVIVPTFKQASEQLAADHNARTVLNETLQGFQDSHLQSATLEVNEKHVDPDVVEALGLKSSKSENGITFTKDQFIPDEVVPLNPNPLSPAELAEYTALLQKLPTYRIDPETRQAENLIGKVERPANLQPSVIIPEETIIPSTETILPNREMKSAPGETKEFFSEKTTQAGYAVTFGEREKYLNNLERIDKVIRSKQSQINDLYTFDENAKSVIKPGKAQELKELEDSTVELEKTRAEWQQKLNEITAKKTYYHGTGSDFKDFSHTRADSDALYGTGTYLTENPEIASEYAQNAIDIGGRPNVRAVTANVKNTFDVRNNVSRAFVEKATESLLLPGLEKMTSLNFKENYLKNRYKDLFQDKTEVSGDRFLTWANKTFNIQPSELLQNLGYDSLTHEGGSRVGKVKHNVLVVFDPKNVESIFSKQESKRLEELDARHKGSEDPNFVPKMEAKSALDNVLNYQTPNELRELNQEKGELLGKAATEKLNEADQKRFQEIDTKLKGADDASYINKVRANEADYLARAKAAGIALPVTWDEQKHAFINNATGESHPFLKGALGMEEFFAPGKDQKFNKPPRPEFVPEAIPLIPVSPDFIVQAPFEETTAKPMSSREVVRSMNDVRDAIAKASGRPASTVKEGGRLKPGATGSYLAGTDVTRVRSLADIPTGIHESAHELSTKLKNLVGAIDKADPKLGDKFVEQAKTFYPNENVHRDRTLALNEGIANFLEHKLLRKPIHKDLLAWWEGPFRQEHPEIYDAYSKVEKLANDYYSQPLDIRTAAQRTDLSPGKLKQFYRNITDINNWIAATDKNIAFRALDKALGLKGLYNNKSYRAFIASHNNSAQLQARNLLDAKFFYDFNKNKLIDQKTYAQIFEGMTPESRYDHELYLDMLRASAMIKREQDPGFSVADVVKNITNLEAKYGAKTLRQKAEEVYAWLNTVQDMMVENSPVMKTDLARIRKANVDIDLPEHGFYVPFERQDKPTSGTGKTAEGNIKTADPFYKSTGSERPLKPFMDRLSNYLTGNIEASLKNQLIDRAIFDYDSGRATGGMIQEITPRNALKFETTYQDMIDRTNKEFKSALDTSMLDSKLLESTIQWWSPETSLKGNAAADGYIIIARPKLTTDAKGNLVRGKGYRFFEVHPSYLEAFSGQDRSRDNALLRGIRATKRVVQLGSTAYKGTFQVRNFLVKDWQSGLLMGEKVKPLELAYNLFAELTDQVVTKWTGRQNSPAAVAQHLGLSTATYMGAMREINHVTKKHGLGSSVWEKVISATEFVTSLGENSTRLAMMRLKARELGIDLFKKGLQLKPEEAIDLAMAFKRGTVDFSQRGNNELVNFIADVTPFAGARLQGAAQSSEAIQSNPKRALALFTTSYALGMYSYLLHAGKDWYDDLSAPTKFVSFNVDIPQEDGRTKLHTFPLDDLNAVGHGLGVLTMQAFHAGADKDVEASTAEAIKAILEKVSPVDLPLSAPGVIALALTGGGPVGRLAAEDAMNKSLFSNRPIYAEKVTPIEDYNEKTSELMKEIGRISGMSPKRIEYWTKTFLSGPLETEKFVEKQLGFKAVNEEEGSNFIVRAFQREASNAAIQDESSSKFYEAVGLAEQKKSNPTEAEEDSRKFLLRAHRKIGELNKVIAVTADKTERDKLYQFRRELFKAGIRSVKNPTIEMPTLNSETEK